MTGLALGSGLGTAGPVLGLLLLLSLASVAVFIARALALGRGVRGRDDRALWLEGLAEGGRPALAVGDTAADRVALRASELLRKGHDGAHVAAMVTPTAQAQVTRLFSGVRPLELIGMIAPLLGLLGTVLGMIQSFRSLEMAEGAANASILAGGIWQALLTTAAGLIVAIPALAGAAWLTARAEAEAQEVETVLAGVRLAGPAPENRSRDRAQGDRASEGGAP